MKAKTHSQLKAKIINKFGSIKAFCKVKNLDHYEVRKFLIRSDRKLTPAKLEAISDFDRIVDNTATRPDPSLITANDRAFIFIQIEKNFGDVQGFVDAFPEFNPNTVYQVINGHRKKKTLIVIDLINTLEKCQYKPEAKGNAVAGSESRAEST